MNFKSRFYLVWVIFLMPWMYYFAFGSSVSSKCSVFPVQQTPDSVPLLALRQTSLSPLVSVCSSLCAGWQNALSLPRLTVTTGFDMSPSSRANVAQGSGKCVCTLPAGQTGRAAVPQQNTGMSTCFCCGWASSLRSILTATDTPPL